jgi:glycosyltransferase involved in cell wall biosynthesis
MKILITSMFYKKSYGQGLCAQKIAEYLAKKGHEIKVFHGEKKEIKSKKNLKIEKISSSKIKGIDLISFSLKLRERIKKERGFDIFYPQDYTFGLVDFNRLKMPVVYHARGTIKGNSDNRPKTEFKTEAMRKIAIPLLIAMDKTCCINASKIIAASEIIKKEIEKYYGIQEKKIKVVSDGVDLKKFSRKKEVIKKAEKLRKKLKLQNKKIILFAGRLVPQKGIIYLIKAMPKVMKYLPGAFLLIAGEDTSENHKKIIEKEIKKMRIQRQVKFLGYVEQKKMPELIEASDLIVSPSTYEPIGIINLEAIAMNKPIIYPENIGSIQTLKESGIKINPAKPEEISNAVTKILSSKKLYSKFSKAGRKNAKKVEWNKIGAKIEKILRKSKDN